MKGLLLKDFMISRKNLSIYAGTILLLFVVMSSFSSGKKGLDGTGLAFIVIYCILFITMSLFTLDESSKWNIYALSLPVDKALLVRSRYLFLVLVMLAGNSVPLLISLFTGSLTNPQVLSEHLGSLAGSLYIISILVPLMYRFGSENARVIIIVFCILFFILSFSLNNYFFDLIIPVLLPLLQGFSVILLLLSYTFSCKILENTDVH